MNDIYTCEKSPFQDYQVEWHAVLIWFIPMSNVVPRITDYYKTNLVFPTRGTANTMLGQHLHQGAESGFTCLQPELQLHLLWLQNEMSKQVFHYCGWQQKRKEDLYTLVWWACHQTGFSILHQLVRADSILLWSTHAPSHVVILHFWPHLSFRIFFKVAWGYVKPW